MKSQWGFALTAMACVSVAGCHFGGGQTAKAPTGQVVATVGNREITVRDLQAEMAGVQTADPKARKAAEQAALKNIIGRNLLAQAAHDQGLDKTPDYALQKQRVLDGLLAQTLQNKLVAAVPAPTHEDADRFIAEHPDLFGQRKVFLVDQIRMTRPSDPAVLKAFQPLKTLEEVEVLLKQNKIPYQRTSGNLDALSVDPRLIDAIMKLPPHEVFVFPSGNVLLVNQIRESKVVPFTGPQASEFALKLMTKQRTQEAVSREFNAILAQSAKKVKFNKDYAPPSTPRAPSGGTGANASSPAPAAKGA